MLKLVISSRVYLMVYVFPFSSCVQSFTFFVVDKDSLERRREKWRDRKREGERERKRILSLVPQ